MAIKFYENGFCDGTDATKKLKHDVSAITTGTERTVAWPNASGTVAYLGSALKSKVIVVSRNTATATGTQAFTGVGFTPSAVIFFLNEGSVTNSEMSIGFADSAKVGGCVFKVGDNTGWSYSGSPIFQYESTGNTYTGAISTYDADGFTISWTKTGSPTGTLADYALCLA